MWRKLIVTPLAGERFTKVGDGKKKEGEGWAGGSFFSFFVFYRLGWRGYSTSGRSLVLPFFLALTVLRVFNTVF